MSSVAYSSTKLADKLGIKPNSIIKLINQPEYYFQLFNEFPDNVTIPDNTLIKKNLIHLFKTNIGDLKEEITNLISELEQNGCIWVSWYKKNSGIKTNLNEDLIREIAIECGLVDIKVCSIDDKWSALKLVIPLKNRKI